MGMMMRHRSKPLEFVEIASDERPPRSVPAEKTRAEAVPEAGKSKRKTTAKAKE